MRIEKINRRTGRSGWEITKGPFGNGQARHAR
jgi:hypothetical protein